MKRSAAAGRFFVAFAARAAQKGMAMDESVKTDGAEKDLRRSTDRRVVRTRKAIREAFFKLMEEQDYHKITIASIAREADIDRKTFYLHYGSVSDLADEIIYDEAQTIMESCRDALRSGGQSINVAELFHSISMALAPDMSRSRLVVQHASLPDMLDRLEASLVEVVLADNALGLKRDDPYLQFTVSFFCAGIVAVYRRWLMSESSIPLDDIAQAASACVFEGLNGVLANMQDAAKEKALS